jgi:hypothetical protein
MARACRTTRAPILISFSCWQVNDQSAIASGSSMQHKKVARLSGELREHRLPEQGVEPLDCVLVARTVKQSGCRMIGQA